MLLSAACILVLLSPVLAGRWAAGLLVHQWRWPLLIWAMLALQVVVVEVSLPGRLAPFLHVATYVVALGFVWANRGIPGIVLVAAGAASNGITIALNGGVLPASPGAVAAAGIDPHTTFANSAVIGHPTLPWLGDVFAWPAPLPLANTFSVGDALIALGVLVAAWTGSRRLGWHLPGRRSTSNTHASNTHASNTHASNTMPSPAPSDARRAESNGAADSPAPGRNPPDESGRWPRSSYPA
jgi:hypothetical protein